MNESALCQWAASIVVELSNAGCFITVTHITAIAFIANILKVTFTKPSQLPGYVVKY